MAEWATSHTVDTSQLGLRNRNCVSAYGHYKIGGVNTDVSLDGGSTRSNR